MIDFLSKIYAFVIRLRNYLFDRGILKSYLCPPVVVSVGNIEAGGTGKTPFTLMLASELDKRGYKVAIVTRGYRGRLKGTIQIMPDFSADDAGDEALMMAKMSKAPVVKSPDRCKGALHAFRKLGAEIVILDDGFQHRKIFRDLDIVLASRDLNKEKMLPSGMLRDEKRSLKRADFVISTKAGSSSEISAELIPVSFSDRNGRLISLDVLKNSKILAFCGLGNPVPFFRELEKLGANVETLVFHDHKKYSEKDIETISVRSAEKDFVVMTDKDMVKIKPADLRDNWISLNVEMKTGSIDSIIGEIEKIVKNRRISRQG